MKTVILTALILIIVVLGGYFLFTNFESTGEQKTTPNTFDIQGMKVEILKQGSGADAKVGDKLTVDYVGTLENGTKFDSSIDRGTPLKINLGVGQVIKGWDLGLLGMKVGEKRKLTIPPELAYGQQVVGPIPANSTLIFEVDLLGINQ